MILTPLRGRVVFAPPLTCGYGGSQHMLTTCQHVLYPLVMSIRKTCQACGHKGGQLRAERSQDMDALVAASGAPITLPTLTTCSGSLFADDGPTACLRRMTARR